MSNANVTKTVKCNNGTFVGKETDELIIWKGIPYATQPVGELRWKKALPAADDDGVYEAINPGHVPIGPVNDSEGTAQFGEDCLVLNVYYNTNCTDLKKPVMVWIHGGGFCAESQASPLYDLSNISRQCPDILFVSIDYRLGFMGFMNFERVPGGENFKEAGNLGLLDQLEALRWVQKNIAGFGGDPDNVTIFGESAGSASVTFLPLIEGSEGLFKRIIAQSANIAYCDTMEHGIHVTQNFLSVTGCQTMDELMKLSTEQFVEAYAKAYAVDKNCLLGGANFPLLDGVTLAYAGKEWADRAYPIKSFFDAGANVVFHSDYPVSPMMDYKLSIYMAEKRSAPKFLMDGDTQRNIGEAITREQSLRALTINVARQFHQEHRLGSVEFGKIANMTVYDCDFLHDDIEKVATANLVATIVDGEEVYKA